MAAAIGFQLWSTNSSGPSSSLPSGTSRMDCQPPAKESHLGGDACCRLSRPRALVHASSSGGLPRYCSRGGKGLSGCDHCLHAFLASAPMRREVRSGPVGPCLPDGNGMPQPHPPARASPPKGWLHGSQRVQLNRRKPLRLLSYAPCRGGALDGLTCRRKARRI